MLYVVLGLVTVMFVWSLLTQESRLDSDDLKKNIFVYVLTILLVLLVGYYGKYSQGWDYEIWNGEVTGKSRNRVSCTHSYTCNCRQVCTYTNKGQSSCRTQCDTCYEHSHDIDYVLKTNVKNNIVIGRVDRQGVLIPSRYEIAQAGDPVAEKNSYVNYIKATKNVYSKDENTPNTYVPDYPIDLYDYHYLKRFLDIDAVLTEGQVGEYNALIAETLKELGYKKQCNLIIVAMKNMTDKRVNAILDSWQDGKKNDIIIFLGTNGSTIDKAKITALATKDMFQVQLRDSLINKSIDNPSEIVGIVTDNIKKNFVRKPMSDFKYLEDEIDFPTWSIVSFIVLMLFSGLGFFVLDL